MKYPIPPLTFLKNTSYKGPNIYDASKDRWWGGLEIRQMFIYSVVFKQQICCSFLLMGVREWELGVRGGYYNCMILNIKTSFDKKVTFLPLVLML